MKRVALVTLITASMLTGCSLTQGGTSQPNSSVNLTPPSTVSTISSPTASGAQTQQPATGKTLLANGLLQPIDPTVLSSIRTNTVRDANGNSVALPTDKPILFFAYWCSHCHDGLKELQSLGKLNDLYFVSIYVEPASLLDNPRSSIHNFQDAKKATDSSLKQLGITIPANHLFYVMPNDPMNSTKFQGVPTFVEHTAEGWYVMNGEPNTLSAWKDVLQYAD